MVDGRRKKLEGRLRMCKWKDLPLIVAETNLFKCSPAIIGYIQPNNK